MRDLLVKADLTRYAGQFVWLELSYDEPRNRAFLTKYGSNATPTFFVIDAHDQQVIAMQPGVMSLEELQQFLDRGASLALAKSRTPFDSALTRADALLREQPAEAAKNYREAIRLAAADRAKRELAEAALAHALEQSKQWQPCAETAASEAAGMKRDVIFVRTVVAGMWCLASADPAPWADAALRQLQPLAEEALSLPISVRDHRDSIYRTLMYICVHRNDNPAALKWGDRWLAELDQIKPATDDERSALDIARVENIAIIGDPERILPELEESERVMPNNYIASLRVAQMENATKRYDYALAACDRGLGRGPGALGKAWLLEIKAQALQMEGKYGQAHQALEQAFEAAQEIPNPQGREFNIARIESMLNAGENRGK
jgi:tetratricopeptide (TPR) repeat protein